MDARGWRRSGYAKNGIVISDEDPLRELVRPADEQEPHRGRSDRDGHLHGHVRQPERRADADELGDADAEVRDEHAAGREERPAHAVLLTYEIGEPLARDEAHPRRHLLHDDERDGDHHHHPQQVVAVARADRGVRRDPAGVVAGVGRDQARAEHREDREDAAARAAQLVDDSRIP